MLEQNNNLHATYFVAIKYIKQEYKFHLPDFKDCKAYFNRVGAFT